VAIQRNANVKEGIRVALDSLGDLTDLLRGRSVAIKTNDTWASPDDTTAPVLRLTQ
jgi:hypothetical protein